MGLTIHYSGSFNPAASLKAMIEEVKDIAAIYNWKYFVFNDKFPENSFGKTAYNDDIYGICFTPPECETVSLCFLSNGRMSNAVNLKFYGNPKNKEEADYLYMLFTKTQYAGPEIHKLIIHLLKYLSKKYFPDFTVSDEGEYWETGDEKLLEENFKRYTALINGFVSCLQNFSMNPGESFEAYFERLLRHMNENYKKED
jgi:hypothetical protein